MANETLVSVFTDIGDAIRAKEKTTAAIPVLEMASRITALKDRFPNGTEWTQSNITDDIGSVYFANGLWVAAGYDGPSFGNQGGVGILYSTDGKYWVKSNITTDNFSPITNQNGIWFACSRKTGLYYSTDGKTWVQTNITSEIANNVFYSEIGLFVASIGQSSSSTKGGFWYSTDGKSWIQGNIKNIGMCALYANGIWVGGGDNCFYYSMDGKTWTKGDGASQWVHDVCYANGLWVATTDVGVYYSIDGKTWTLSNLKDGCYGVEFASGVWVANRYSRGGIYYSADGKTWTLSNVTSGDHRGFHNANGLWVATGSSGVYYSPNGKVWTKSNLTKPLSTPLRPTSAYNANGIWVAAPGETGIYYSVTWEPES